ncbi:DUF2142 domain-containing protein [Arcanobacterium haemolyticum]|nr:DUF2142 domain-containing protein [Arcanobacterium haemolyticum]
MTDEPQRRDDVASEVSPNYSETSKSKTTRFLLGVIGALAVFFSGLGWVLASPLGGSPDEDYHMGSIWCPRPAGESCDTKTVNGVEEVLVPEAVAQSSTCHAFHPENSAACTAGFSDDHDAYSSRYDAGNYPKEYYRFHHLFVGESVTKSVLIMRTINLGIAVALVAGVCVLLKPRYRSRYLLAILVSWVPMGVYYVASVNPSSWSITGTYVYAGALFASLTSDGTRKKYASLGLALVGALLCAFSRGDSATFMFVVSIAMLLGIEWDIWRLPQKLFAALVSLWGLYVMFGGGQAGIVSSSESSSQRSILDVALRSVLQFPDYLAAFYGRGRGPGWFDTSLDTGPIAIVAVGIGAAALVISLRRITWRKFLAMGAIAGAIFGMPFLTTLQGVQPEFVMYQPRYMLPLLAVFFFLAFVLDDSEEPVFTLPQLVFVLFSLVSVYSLALKRVLWRYVSGLDKPEPLFNINFDNEWWWNINISPLFVWISSTFAIVVALFVVAWLLKPHRLLHNPRHLVVGVR